MTAKRHHYSSEDDIVAFYLSRYRAPFLPLAESEIAERLGMSKASLTMRQGSFAYRDGRGGLDHVAEQSRRVHDQYGKMSESELRPLVLKALKRSLV